MDRRHFNRVLAFGTAGVVALPEFVNADAVSVPLEQDNMMQVMTRFVDELSEGDARIREQIAPTRPRKIAMVAYPGMFPLDLLGPLTVFSDLLGTQVHLVWKNKQPIGAGRGVALQPISFSDCPNDLDVLFVPGGTTGTIAAIRDDELLTFLRQRAATARFVTSVCTGSLVLGAAGLLQGYRATSHWLTHELLTEFGAKPVKARVVEDRNRITGAGVTAGLDFALYLVGKLAGTNYAKAEQLNIEYDPDPPFKAGSEKGAGPVVAGALRRMYGSPVGAFKSAVREAARKVV